MSDQFHRFHDLFAQLGLPNTAQDIAAFLQRHRPLPNDVLLAEAPFWDASQAQFIREKKQQDAPEWIQLIDQLSEALRETAAPRSAAGASRVLALSGSLRQASLNTALAHAAKALAPHGMAVEVATLHGIPLYDADVESAEGIPQAVLALKARILQADALLLVTPEYNNGVPGVFKNGIDWLSRADGKAIFAQRPTGLIGASMGGFGTLLSQTAWLPTLKLLGANVYSASSVLISRAHNAFDAEGGLTDAAGQKNLAAYLAGFEEFVLQARARQAP